MAFSDPLAPAPVQQWMQEFLHRLIELVMTILLVLLGPEVMQDVIHNLPTQPGLSIRSRARSPNSLEYDPLAIPHMLDA